jgi:hypothetical protein
MGVAGMRDAFEAILIVALIAGYVYGRVNLYSDVGIDQVPFMGPKKIQTLFGDDPDRKS